MSAAATPRPSPMPPAASTGIFTASTTWGVSAMVVRSPTWPPDSPPSATTAQAPMRSHMRAMATEGTTGTTLRPFSTQVLMYLEGRPAPVTTTGTFSSTTTCATSSA